MRLSRRGNDIRTLQEWRDYAPPKGGDAHWQDGKSAKELARAWVEPDGPAPPKELLELFPKHPAFAGTSLQEGFPEHRVRFDQYPGECRNADLNLVGKRNGENVALSVEGKSDESFGGTVSGAIARAHRRKDKGKATNGDLRVQDLLIALLPAKAGTNEKVLQLPYQLFTGIAGLLAWAQSVNASAALFVVHEFTGGLRSNGRAATLTRNIERNGKALNLFLSALRESPVSLELGAVEGPFSVPGNAFIPGRIPLFVGKLRRDLS